MINKIMFGMIILIFTSCYYDVEDEIYQEVSCNLPETMSFDVEIKPIIQQNCATTGCHIAEEADRINLETYSEIKSAVDNNSIQTRLFDDKSMPPTGPMATCEVRALLNWIEQGALDN